MFRLIRTSIPRRMPLQRVGLLRFNHHSHYNASIRQNIAETIQRNPHLLTQQGSIASSSSTWTTLRNTVLLVALSSSLTMVLYVSVEVHSVRQQDVLDTHRKPKNIMLPLWFSCNWPSQRRYSLGKYLRYFDQNFSDYISDADIYKESLQENGVEFQVLNDLFRLSVIRSVFSIPLTMRATPQDTFDIWIEPHTAAVHGPLITISKNDNDKISLVWQWSIRPIHFGSFVDRFLSDKGFSFDKLESHNAERKTHEKSSGHIHEVRPSKIDEKRSKKDRDFSIRFSGTFHVHDNPDNDSGKRGLVTYSGYIDLDHLAINSGVKILLLDVSILEPLQVSYKIL